jgi:phosphoglycolate phosphatase
MTTGTTPRFPAPVFTGPRILAAIIDLDGTMIDTADDFTAGLNGMLAQLDAAETSREEVVGYVGKGSDQEEYARINGRHTRLYPDVEAGLVAMRDAGLKLACVTNKPHRFAVELLQQYGLLGYFSVVIGGDSLPKKKPDPLPMLTACAELQVAPEATVAIGDSENDALAGRAAGMATLTVPYGYNHGQAVQTIKSDGIVASLLEAAKAIAAHHSMT